MSDKLIIFDCDGVLVDSESITNQVLVDYVGELGVKISLNEALERFQGGALSDWIVFLEKEHNISIPKDFTQSFRQKMNLAFEKDLKAVDGIVELLESIKDSKICIASNGPLEKMDTTLRVTNLKTYFGNDIFSAYQIQKWKPDPSLFLYAADQMGVAPKNCTVIEDSPCGVQAAKTAGMKAYGFDVYGKTEALKKEGAILFESMNSLIGKI